MKYKKSQAWGIDLMIAIVIFSIGLVAFYFYSLNYPNETNDNINKLFYDGELIAKDILSEGYPQDWNSENVIKTGILSDNKINETKLERFYDLSKSDYTKTKILFNTALNYYYFLSENMSIHDESVEGIGSKPQNPENLVKITRFTVYKEKPITFTLYVWN